MLKIRPHETLLAGLLLVACSSLHSQEARSSLQREYDLKAQYAVGDKDFYHLRSLYLEMDDSGWVRKSFVLDGYYTREAVALDSKDHTDRFIWKGVRTSERQGRGKFTNYSVLPFSVGYECQFSASEVSGKHFPAGITAIPRTPQGFQFFVKLIDASTFDILRSFEHYGPPLTHIGQVTTIPAEDLQGIIDFPPLYTNTHFVHTATRVTFSGITLSKGIPCALIEFREDDAHIHMTMNMMNMKFPSDGTSYYWGTILVGLETGKIVGATLCEHVVTVINLAPAGPVTKSIVRRELTLETLDQEEYEQVRIGREE